MDNPLLSYIQKWINKDVTTLHSPLKKRYIFLIGIIIFFLGTYWLVISPPRDFPSRSIISVPQGSGLLRLSAKLKNEGIIRSEIGFRTLAIIFGGERVLQAGDYYLPHPENVIRMAYRIVHGERSLASIRVTIPEGYTAREISDLFDSRFQKFDHAQFVALAPEGYLFPDTYFMEMSSTASSTIQILQNNFLKKIAPYESDVASSTHSLKDIVTMASILESEGSNKTDREIISGILWRRISIHMPLQVDASLKYINGKTSSELTVSDLNADSPYNTYKYAGLPPGPISNPGLESILAALHPADSNYLYFLTDNDGIMHYARTFDEHKKNKAKYLGN